jgi:PPM family protein phosphatase
MMRVISAGRTDVGRVRSANEDAFHLGDSVFAVADGMGGHVAGEVASTTALEPIAKLDGHVFSDATEATTALRDAVIAANRAVVDKAAGDPNYRGMGTTLTAVMIEGRRAHIAHVGDSRAYLLREGSFSQLTNDHTLVQRLIEEGRLTREEAARHPQRSVITRAIGVDAEVEVDAMALELEPGDVMLLCSDGLTGPVEDDAILSLLSTDEPIGDVADALIEAANEAGGPDNITAVVLRFEELPTAPARKESATVLVRSRSDDDDSADWASRLGRLGSFSADRGTGHDAEGKPPSSRSQRMVAVIVGVGLILGAVLVGGRWMLSRSFYVGVDDDRVAIFQGVPGDLGPLSLSWHYEDTRLRLEDVPVRLRGDIEDGMTAADLADARRIVDNFLRQAEAESATEDPAATPSPTGTEPGEAPTP